MKKYFSFMLLVGLAVSGCSGNSSSGSDSSSESSSSSSSQEELGMVSDVNEISKIWSDEYQDDGNGFASLADVSSATFRKNGESLSSFPTDLRASSDHTFEFYNRAQEKVRYVDKSNGYALTLPLNNGVFDVDYTLAKYRLKVTVGDAIVNLSMENNAYSGNSYGYNIYVTEWFDRYINNPKYLEDNNMEYFKSTVYRDETILNGYDVTIWSVKINNADGIERPYYQVALIRQLNQFQKVFIMHLKSSRDESELLSSLMASYKVVSAKGNAMNYVAPFRATPNPMWNAETTAYYAKLMEKKSVDFGVFTKSMPNDDSSNWNNIDTQLGNQVNRLQSEDQGLGHVWEIMPTYTHIGWYNEMHYFPNVMAKKYADGNGFNGKPVLQFTYQFTTNNNAVTPQNTTNLYTPMFDILRGKFDEHLHQLAKDMKAYQRPVLFRLNNEMNTDWTSYCGMMTLCDPDIFNATWIYLYNIFNEEGVDNAIWIWNPTQTSCPYSRWGEDLSYFPGEEYVQILGLTHYEMNNGDGNVPSFKTMYQDVYNKNNTLFGDLPWVISEFACGSGGNADGSVLYRNQPSQSAWVAAMLDDWKNRATNPFVQNIVGAVWFSCHDYAGDLVVNALGLDAPLTDTISAFKIGFDALDESL